MDCADARLLISADADGEASPAERHALDEHRRRCADCARYTERVAQLDRRVRLQPAPPVPDLADAVLGRVRPARRGWARPSLAWVTIVVVAQSVPALVLGNADGATTHVSRHLGAFGVALGVALVYCAWKPERAYALLPFTGVLIGCTIVASLFDIVDSGLGVLTETPHVPELVAFVLQWWIAGSPRPRLGGHRRRVRPALH